MNSRDATVVELSRTRPLLLLVAASVFFALSIWLAAMDPTSVEMQRRFANPGMMNAMGFAGILFFGAFAIHAGRKVFSGKPGLILDSRGITDNSGSLSAGLIPWEDIAGVRLHREFNQKILVVKLRDPERYIRQGGRWRQSINRTNFKQCGSPVTISPAALQADLETLHALFETYLDKYRDPALPDPALPAQSGREPPGAL